MFRMLQIERGVELCRRDGLRVRGVFLESLIFKLRFENGVSMSEILGK